ETGARRRIEIEGDEVHVVDRLHAGKPRILGDRRELCRVHQRFEITADEMRPIFRGLDGFDAYAFRRFFRAVLIERVRGDAVRKALPYQGSITNCGEEGRCDLGVVSKQVTLRELQFRPEDLVEVGDAQRVATRQFKKSIAAAVLDRAELIDQV